MSNKKTSNHGKIPDKGYFGSKAKQGSQTLQSFTLGALPILNALLKRIGLTKHLAAHLPKEDARSKIPTITMIQLLIQNILLSREPIYGIAEWAQRYQPELLGLSSKEMIAALNDDRAGRALEKLFETSWGPLLLDLMRHVVQEFDVRLDELHSDPTTVSFFGAYQGAEEPNTVRGQPVIALLRGHSKAHRPDLKQLLYNLVVSDDGAVPMYFSLHNGNTSDCDTHCDTWDFLCELAGHSHFLYVADSKAATAKNMKHIDEKGGRFISVLPGTRKEEKAFRKQLLSCPEAVPWELLYEEFEEESPEEESRTKKKKTKKTNSPAESKAASQDPPLKKRISICKDDHVSEEGYKILWCHNTQKQDHDIAQRARQVQRAVEQLRRFREKLHSPKTRYRQHAKVAGEIESILKRYDVESYFTCEITQQEVVQYKKKGRGRPTENSTYTKQVSHRFNFSFTIDSVKLAEANATAGIFSLITNEKELSNEEIVRAYGRQPIIEKRFSQLKTDFEVSPVYLKSVPRIQALMCVYFLVLLVQSLLEREIRGAMQEQKLTGIPLYPEQRNCKRPTTRRIVDIFENIQRHTLKQGEAEQIFHTELSPLQDKILDLLNISKIQYGE